jgi:hypothetical protein
MLLLQQSYLFLLGVKIQQLAGQQVDVGKTILRPVFDRFSPGQNAVETVMSVVDTVISGTLFIVSIIQIAVSMTFLTVSVIEITVSIKILAVPVIQITVSMKLLTV